jgi:hypothetical protein
MTNKQLNILVQFGGSGPYLSFTMICARHRNTNGFLCFDRAQMQNFHHMGYKLNFWTGRNYFYLLALLGIREEGPTRFPQWSFTTHLGLRWNNLMTSSSFSTIHFAGGQSLDRRWSPGSAYVAEGGINETEGRKPHCDGSSTEGLTMLKARSQRRCSRGHVSTRDRLNVEIIVNHKWL